MFAALIEKKETIIDILCIGLFLFVMSRAYGIANLLRFLFRYLNIGYSDRKMKSLDEKWFNVQLFKIINRINVTKIEDARIIQKGLNDGALKASLFYFTSSWGDITVAMPTHRKILSFLMGLTLISLGAVAWYVQKPIVEGYAKIDYTAFSYYLSKNKMFIIPKGGDIKSTSIRSKQDCRNALKIISETSILAIACTKFLDDSESYQWWLNDEIELVNDSKKSLLILAYVYIALGVLWMFSGFQFLRAGNMVRKYKELTERTL